MALFGLFKKENKQQLDKGLSATRDNLFSRVARAVVGKSRVDDEVLDSLEEVLLSSDVGVPTTLRIIERLQERVSRDKFVGTSELNRLLKEEVAGLMAGSGDKLIYNLVLEAQQAGLAACVPGNGFNEPHRAAMKIIAAGLADLGIIAEASEARKYFMHGTSHYLGLDVHDAGTYGPLKPGSVITVEPGIYIREGAPCDRRWWNIGVRIEDDVLITESGHEVLSRCVPKMIPEIEAIMMEKSIFNEMQ